MNLRRDAVRIALTSGLRRKQVADDLGVGMSEYMITERLPTGVGRTNDVIFQVLKYNAFSVRRQNLLCPQLTGPF